MSEFYIEIVEIKEIKAHPNADLLEIAKAYDYPVVVKKGQFSLGDLAVYVCVDAEVPDKDPWKFLGNNRRIRAKKLRGIYSQGLLMPLSDFPEFSGMAMPFLPGTQVHELLGITKWEPQIPLTMRGENERDPGFMPV